MVISKETLKEIWELNEPDILYDLNYFVKAANELKTYARSCNPQILRVALKFEKLKNEIVSKLKKTKLSQERKIKAVRVIRAIYDDAINYAEKEIEVCFK